MTPTNKRKLVIATDNFLPRWDGIARFLAEIIPRLNDYDITIISPDYGPSPFDETITRIRVPLQRTSIGDYTSARWRPGLIKPAIREADIVFTQTIGPIGLLASIYARRYKKKHAAFIHSIEWELVPKAIAFPLLKKFAYPLTKWLARFVYNRAGLLIVPSSNIGDHLTWQRITTKKTVAHLGVDTKRFTKGDRARAREQLKLPKDALIVGYHGRLGNEKNLITLARAYLRLKARSKRLLIVGDGLASLRKQLGAVRGALIVGAQDDVVPWLQAMDIYVLPSFTETTSLAVLEAMSCELPVVSSPVGFIQQYIKHGENGFFYETKNSYELARRLQELADNPELRRRIGSKARATVQRNFDWDVSAQRIMEALNSL
ncbi:glycosyltransferase family 1 protein [Candidatus Woesearchaeota archaeon]|nr:MAG: glycosyltransferase family 1 protein [Candidatus Woesearchaeota archaeon]